MGPADEQARASSRPAARDPLLARRGPGVLLAVLLAVALGGMWSAITYAPGIDFYQFWVVGQAVEEKLVDDVYAPEARPRLAQTFLGRAALGSSRRQQAAADFR